MVQRGPQVLALEQALNPAVPYLHRVALTDTREAPAVKPMAVPQGWAGRQVYQMDGVVGLPDDTDQLRFERRSVSLVPFAETQQRARVDHANGSRASRPARCHCVCARRVCRSYRSVSSPPSDGACATDIAEFVTDEDPHTYCTVNPQDPGLANYLGAPPGKRGDPVWFEVMLKSPATISRVVFRHGAVSATGGWFDTTARDAAHRGGASRDSNVGERRNPG